jgi:hypothetical protein
MMSQECKEEEKDGPKFGSKFGLRIETAKQLELSAKLEVKVRQSSKKGYELIWDIIEEHFESPTKKWLKIEQAFRDADSLYKKFMIIKNSIRELAICTDKECPAFRYYSLEEKIDTLEYKNPGEARNKLPKSSPRLRNFEEDYETIKHKIFKFKEMVEMIFTMSHGDKERRKEAQESNERILSLMDGAQATANIDTVDQQLKSNENILFPNRKEDREPDRDYKWKNKKHGGK